ncbi:MAG: hypothetical protein ABSE71_02935 [Candidatus Micrarchaeaceae archaeon]|jgi:hypothetical protein|nr:hypothetical protein [Candidatus Micrarchaeota archaeon]HII09994.1 hypothetical protein [Candidatus Micrarchaeota archaeon]
MLVFTKLLMIFAVILLVIGAITYMAGYSLSGTPSLSYYLVKNQSLNPTAASNNFMQNGMTTLKYFGIFMVALCVIFLACAAVNERLKLSQKFHHLKYSKPLH